MKNIYRYIILLAALLTSSTVLKAQMNPGEGLDGVVFNKEVHEGTVPNSYELTIDAFVTGKIMTTDEIQPSDIVLVLDLSSSMQNNNVNVESRTRVSTGTTLNPSTNYKVVINGEEYYLKMFYRNYNGGYYVRYKADGVPTSRTDGSSYLSSEYIISQYVVKDADEIYTYTTESVTRLEALKRASQQFIETVYNNSPSTSGSGEPQCHKIATVVFNREAKTYINLQDVTNSSKETMKTSIGKLEYTELSNQDEYYKVTNPAIGLNQAANVLDAVKNDGRNKVVVFFTDGVPCDKGSDNFNHGWAREAVNMSYVLKQPMGQTFASSYTYKDPKSGNTGKTYTSGYGAKVYSVAILSSESAQIRHFLHFVSSNYPNQRLASNYNFPNSYTGTGGEAPHDYYQLSSGADLSSIFTKIAKESAQADINLSATSTSVIDIISESFVIPEDTPDGEYDGTKYETNQKGNAIGLYVAPVTGYSNGEYTFGTEVLAKTAKDGDESICPDVKAIVAGDKLTVTGFDYSKYCVAEVEGSNPKQYKGYKLVIKIKIEINPANPGGADVPTNKIGSGIYYEGKQIAEFQQPDVKIPNIIIIKKGLKKGESATFTVEGKDMSPMILVATCKADGADAIAKAKIQKPGRYTVTENTWSWAYDLSTLVKDYAQEDNTNKTVVDEDARSITRNVNVATENSDYHGTLFIFENAAKENMPDHGESYKLNVFYEQNTNK